MASNWRNTVISKCQDSQGNLGSPRKTAGPSPLFAWYTPSLHLVPFCQLHIPYCPKQAPMGTRSSSAKKWGWAVTQKRCLNGSTIPMQGPIPDAKLAARVYRIIASSVLRRGQPDSGESCVMLQSRPTCSLIAKFPQRSVVACTTQISCCRERMLGTRPRTGVCEPLMPDVVVSKVHQNNCSYVNSADLPSDSLHKNLAWWADTQRTSKNHKTVKIGGWALAQDNTVPQTLNVHISLYPHLVCNSSFTHSTPQASVNKTTHVCHVQQ